MLKNTLLLTLITLFLVSGWVSAQVWTGTTNSWTGSTVVVQPTVTCTDYLSYYNCVQENWGDESICQSSWCDTHDYSIFFTYNANSCPYNEYLQAYTATETILAYTNNETLYHQQAHVNCKAWSTWSLSECEARCDVELINPSSAACKSLCQLNPWFTPLNHSDTCTSRLACVAECNWRGFSLAHCSRECTIQCTQQWATLNGFVYQDIEWDKLLNNPDKWILGVTVTLKNTTGAIVATTTTDINWRYEFDWIPWNTTYTVEYSNNTSLTADSAQPGSKWWTTNDLFTITAIDVVSWDIATDNNFWLIKNIENNNWAASSISNTPNQTVSTITETVEEEVIVEETPIEVTEETITEMETTEKVTINEIQKIQAAVKLRESYSESENAVLITLPEELQETGSYFDTIESFIALAMMLIWALWLFFTVYTRE